MMGNWLSLGPVRLRIGSRHLASWGYERLAIGGLSFWSRSNNGELILASYHPKGCNTWHWSVSISRRNPGMWHHAARRRRWLLKVTGNAHVAGAGWRDVFMQRDGVRLSQWHDYYRLPFGYALVVAQQDYHKRRPWERTRS